MANSGDANGLLGVGELIEDPVGADSQRAKASQFAAKSVPGARIALKQAKCILDRVNQRPVEFKQLAPGSARKDELGQ